MIIKFCERNGLIVNASRSLREDCKHGRHQEISVDISWTVCLWNIDSETVWRMYRHCLGQLLTLTTTYLLSRSAPDWRKNYKVPKEKKKMGFREIICSTTKSAGYCRRETWCNWVWQWECRSAVEQYKGMCVRYCQWSGWESREESKKTVDYAGNDQ